MWNQLTCFILIIVMWALSALIPIMSEPSHEVPVSMVEEAAKIIPNFHVVTPASLVRGGQPSGTGLQLLKDAGIKTVVNLRNEEVLVEREAKFCQTVGLSFVNIPLDVFNEPSDDDVARFLAVVCQKSNQPIFVHCLHGQDRTGAMIGIYRLKQDGWSAKAAYEEMLAIGFRPGLVNLTRAVFNYAGRLGRPEPMPSTEGIVDDLKRRIFSPRGRAL